MGIRNEESGITRGVEATLNAEFGMRNNGSFSCKYISFVILSREQSERAEVSPITALCAISIRGDSSVPRNDNKQFRAILHFCSVKLKLSY